jgi:hypothetical protein
MLVEKTVPRSGRTLAHGRFEARETVHACAAGCRWPSGAKVTRRAACLSEALVPGANVGYDVMVFVGRKRFLESEQRANICEALQKKQGVLLSEGEVSHLAVRFTEYLARLHRAAPMTSRLRSRATAAGRCTWTPPERRAGARCSR